MSVKIRLQRYGRKQAPFYHVVVADSRAPRDGKFIEKIGSYRPSSQPATIELDVDKALNWLKNGAQPTETVRAILSYKGVMFKKHLHDGVLKGALTAEQAEEKYNTWIQAKEAKIKAHEDQVAKTKSDAKTNKLAAESKIKEERAIKLAAKAAELAKAEADAAANISEEATATEEQAVDNTETAAE